MLMPKIMWVLSSTRVKYIHSSRTLTIVMCTLQHANVHIVTNSKLCFSTSVFMYMYVHVHMLHGERLQ